MVDEEEIIRVAELMKIDLEDHGEHVGRVKKMLEYFDILDQIDLSSAVSYTHLTLPTTPYV